VLEYLAAASADLAAHTEAAGGAEHHAEAVVAGVSFLTPGFFVALAMLVVFAIMLKARVPSLIATALDAKIAGIREQLDEAAKLRAEAEALKAEYQAKIAAAAKDADAMRAAAEEEAADLIKEAKAEAEALVKRRQKMAEDKIAAAERAAIADVRARAASAATAAAAALIKQTHDAKADKGLVDDVIGKLTH